MSRLQQDGIEQTALHHHVLHESSLMLYLYVPAHGDPVRIAETINAAVALTKAPSPQLARGLRAVLDLTNSRRRTP
jgi:hypothetical protein